MGAAATSSDAIDTGSVKTMNTAAGATGDTAGLQEVSGAAADSVRRADVHHEVSAEGQQRREHERERGDSQPSYRERVHRRPSTSRRVGARRLQPSAPDARHVPSRRPLRPECIGTDPSGVPTSPRSAEGRSWRQNRLEERTRISTGARLIPNARASLRNERHEPSHAEDMPRLHHNSNQEKEAFILGPRRETTDRPASPIIRNLTSGQSSAHSRQTTVMEQLALQRNVCRLS